MEDIIFWNVDTQKDFMLPTGKLYVKGAEELLPNLSRLTSLAVRNGIVVVSTGDYHSLEDKEIATEKADFVNTFPPHCLLSEEGCDFVNETYPKLLHRHYYLVTPTTIGELLEHNLKRAKDIVIFKNKFDVFEGNNYTDKILDILSPKKVVVYGVATDYCVNYAIQGLLKRCYNVILIKDAIKGISEQESKRLLEYWNEMNVELVTTNEVEVLINGRTKDSNT